MKSIYLVRSPLLKRKKRFGLFKEKVRTIGPIKFKLEENNASSSDIIIEVKKISPQVLLNALA